MHDDDDIHEPEHDHLLDHEFHDQYIAPEPEAGGMDEDEDDEDDDAWGLLDDDDDQPEDP